MMNYVLNQQGKTISETESRKSKRYQGGTSQEPHRDSPVWHNRQDLIHSVAVKMRISPEFYGPKRIHADFENIIDQEIAKLKARGILADWNGAKSYGLWRLARPLAFAEPDMTAQTIAAQPPQYKGDLKQVFVSILTQGGKDNTYKFTLAKSLLDYCAEHADEKSQTHEIEYRYFAEKFLKYYWHQEYKFRMKQDFRVKSKPKVITAINEVFGKNPPADFALLDEKDKERATKRILATVFGHARTKTSLVIPRFQNVRYGRYVEKQNVFYDYDDDRKILAIKPEAFDFLRQNHVVLSKVVLAEWAKFLERINKTLPLLVSKIESYDLERGSLSEYNKLFFPQYEEHCFYCGGRLEREFIHVDHFIPWSYIFEDRAWNLVLACQTCNLKKSASLPQEEFRESLVKRNKRYYDKIRVMQISLDQLDTGRGWRPEIENHYRNCQDYGFNVIRLP